MPRKNEPRVPVEDLLAALHVRNGHNFITLLAPGGIYVTSSQERWTGGWVVIAPGRRIGQRGQVAFALDSRRFYARGEAEAFIREAFGVESLTRKRIGTETFYFEPATWERGVAKARELAAAQSQDGGPAQVG